MIIGAFNDAVFEVSNFKVLTFKDFRRRTKGHYAEHKIINNPAVLEFLGRDLEEITLSITLHKSLGVDPFDTVNLFREMVKNGEPGFLVIGNHAFGENEWVITDLEENVPHWDVNVTPLVAEVDLTFKEYVTVYAE